MAAIAGEQGAAATSRSPAPDSTKFFLIALVPICRLLEHGQGGSAPVAPRQ
jgi:hypothetical protein